MYFFWALMENNGITFEFGLPSNNYSSLISTLTTFPGCFPTTLLIDTCWQSCHCRLCHWAVWSKTNLCRHFGLGCAAQAHQQGLRDTKKVGHPLTYNFTHKCLLTPGGKAAEVRGESRGHAFPSVCSYNQHMRRQQWGTQQDPKSFKYFYD